MAEIEMITVRAYDDELFPVLTCYRHIGPKGKWDISIPKTLFDRFKVAETEYANLEVELRSFIKDSGQGACLSVCGPAD